MLFRYEIVKSGSDHLECRSRHLFNNKHDAFDSAVDALQLRKGEEFDVSVYDDSNNLVDGPHPVFIEDKPAWNDTRWNNF